ncbi:MAG: HypC/HybG/HupF family hydrogenase formation chaperone [Verrucomicrobiae bacterium]|nr:HypC/HybG/HupF family hydrogenase formation chaperone [Verrucomicrobiae bacterium]
MCLAVPGRVVEIQGDDPLWRSGRIDFGGVLKDISLACVPEVVIGDYVIVHAGVAISRLDPDEAARVLEQWRALEALIGPEEPPP